VYSVSRVISFAVGGSIKNRGSAGEID